MFTALFHLSKLLYTLLFLYTAGNASTEQQLLSSDCLLCKASNFLLIQGEGNEKLLEENKILYVQLRLQVFSWLWLTCCDFRCLSTILTSPMRMLYIL